MNSFFTFACAPSNAIFLLLPASNYERALVQTMRTGDWRPVRQHANADHLTSNEELDQELLELNPLRYIWSRPANVGWATAGLGLISGISYRSKSPQPFIWLNVCALGFRLGQYKYPK